MNATVLQTYPEYNHSELDHLYNTEMSHFNHKIIVLDDDPTGIQKVHDIYVYTDWDEASILDGFQSDKQMFFILTNSRAFSKEKTKQVHEDITKRIEKISKQLNKPFIIISRSDSTLRGHFPLETETIKQTLTTAADEEIIIPFFKEGERYTIDNIHYVQNEDVLVSAAETEFAQVRTFGFHSSHLGAYVEEKSNGAFKKEDVTYIQLDDLRALHIEKITNQLMNVNNFNKVVVNAISDNDLKVFSISLIKALTNGKQFLFRTAASFTKVIGHIADQELLSKNQMIQTNNTSKVVVNAISDDELKVYSISHIKALTNGKQFLFRTADYFTKVIGHIDDQELLSKNQMIQTNHTPGGLIIVGSHVN